MKKKADEKILETPTPTPSPGLNMLHQHGPVRYEMPTEKELQSIPKSDLDKLQDAVRTDKTTGLKQLQKTLDAFPWKELGSSKPKLMPPSGAVDSGTQQAISFLTGIANDFKEPNLIKMLAYIESEDYFNAQSTAYVAKSMLAKALHQFQKYPNITPEMMDKYPGLRKWTREEMFAHMRVSPYPGYFPKPWDLSRLGRRRYDGSFGCDPSKEKCDLSYYEGFMSWGPPQGTLGAGVSYDPRLFRNMDKFPNIWSNRAIRYRMNNNIPSPHISSSGTGPWLDIKNMPKGKMFLDQEDKDEYFRLLELYNQFKQEENMRGTSYIAPPPIAESFASVNHLAKMFAEKYGVKN
ncbi:hypothetical protein LCGC14_0469870 [marine sediment metagenome]|uniref:Uncharacterized protein n=1 Tax=marine sediment metagenome TaxID=412755 RepID=A0A0F9SVI2_9ZZZZ